MDTGGPSVTVHVDRELARAYFRAVTRPRLFGWIGFTSLWGAWLAMTIAWDGGLRLGDVLTVVLCGGPLLFLEAQYLRRNARLPVGHDLVAEFGDVALRIQAPGFPRELPYANFRNLERRGPIMRLEDGLGEKTSLPSVVFTSDTEAWFRQHAHPRDLATEPSRPGWLAIEPEAGMASRLSRASVLRNDLRETGWPVALGVAVNVVLGILVSAETAVLVGGFFVILLVATLGHAYLKLRDRLEFRYASQVVRVGPEAGAWIVDSVNHRERIDPAAVTLFERRRGLVHLRHTTAGEEHREVFPEDWVAGLLAPRPIGQPAN